jgi:hypothetical protein
MSTEERMELLGPFCRHFPELGFRGREDLQRWLDYELGNWRVLDAFVPLRWGLEVRALAPPTIYHVLAGNLPVSGWHSLLGGLLLGSRNYAKVPRGSKDSFARFLSLLPSLLQAELILTESLDWKAFEEAQAILAFGREETLELLRKRVRPNQKFLAYGPRVSLAWIDRTEDLPESLLDQVAYDFCLYNQMGCLSPQSLLVLPQAGLREFCDKLAEALTRVSARLPSPALDPEAARRIRQARLVAQAMGWPLWTPGQELGWTLILRRTKEFYPSCGHCVVYVDVVTREGLRRWLRPAAGKLSTIASLEPLDAELETIFLEHGAWRFCPLGKSQHPLPWGHHDGRPRLSDLVYWINREWVSPGYSLSVSSDRSSHHSRRREPSATTRR